MYLLPFPPLQLQMRHRPQKGAELHATIPESGISSCGGFIQDPQLLQQQQQHSLSNVHQWATAAAMNRKSLDDVDLAMSKQHLNHSGVGGYYVYQQPQQQQQQEGAYYYSRSGAGMIGSGNGGGTLPRNFGGLIKEDKVRPVAKVQAQVVMRQVPSPPLKDTPAYVMAQQQQQQQVAQPVYVNFGQLSSHVHHHYYGGDVNTNTIALSALQMGNGAGVSSNSSAIVVNTQAEVHHHHSSQGGLDRKEAGQGYQKGDVKVSGRGGLVERGGINKGRSGI